MSGSGRGYNTLHGFDQGPPPPSFTPAQGFGIPQYNFQPQQFSAPTPAFGFQPMLAPPQIQYAWPGYAQQTHPAPAPATDHGFPGVHLRNHTGGVGLPTGYDYIFPRENVKIHVFKTSNPPWQSNTPLFYNNTNHVKLMVPTNATVKELMQGLGCDNKDAKKNVLHEITEGGNGKWYKGLTITGDNEKKMKTTIAEMGWDKTRTGNPGEKPVVWLWVTKD